MSRRKRWHDRLPGGLADDRTPEDFDPKALARGLKVELEHTSDRDLATEIAMDHLTEDPDYYEKLATIEEHNPGYGPSRPGRIPTWVKPPKAAQRLAARALKNREALPRSKRGGLSRSAASSMGITSGVERAKSIARGDWQPAEDVNAFFQRFKGTHQDALLKGNAWRDSKVQQAWDLWGGTSMWNTAKKALGKSSKQTPRKSRKTTARDLVRKALK